MYNKNSCLYRECHEGGVDRLETLPEEENKSYSAPNVKRKRFEYVLCGTDSSGKDKKMLRIVTKETCPGEMIDYFKGFLKGFPAHQFRASWQHEQFKELPSKLPFHHTFCVHHYSENYARCSIPLFFTEPVSPSCHHTLQAYISGKGWS